MQSLLHGASKQQRNTLDSDANSLGMAKQARRGVETMLDQAAGVLEGMGATRDTLKVRLSPQGTLLLSMLLSICWSGLYKEASVLSFRLAVHSSLRFTVHRTLSESK